MLWLLLISASIPFIVLESRNFRHDHHESKLVTRTNPSTDEFFFRTKPGRGICRQLAVAAKLLSSSSSAAYYECRRTPGCTHVTRNVRTRETFLCSGFVDLVLNTTNWVYSVRASCGPWEKFLYADLQEDVRESLCEKQFLDGCPDWTYPVREPWHKSPQKCSLCPPEGCPVPKSLIHVDTLSKPLNTFALSIGSEMKAMNPSLYKQDGNISIVFRITNQTRCQPLEPITSDEDDIKTYISYVAHVELDPFTMAVREDT